MKVTIDGIEYIPRSLVEPPSEIELAALNVRFDSRAGNNISVRDYLFALLNALWQGKEGFNSKRPFGDSGWENEIFRPLVIGGFIRGEFDIDDDWAEVADRKEANAFVSRLIRAAFYGTASE